MQGKRGRSLTFYIIFISSICQLLQSISAVIVASSTRNLINSNTNIANMLNYCKLSQALIVLLNRFSQEQNQKFASWTDYLLMNGAGWVDHPLHMRKGQGMV